MERKQIGRIILYPGLIITTVLYFLFGQGVRWYHLGGDSESYYTHLGHHIEAKPLYPLFLHMLEEIFGSNAYLYAASVIQMIFSVVCILIFVSFLDRELELGIPSVIAVWAASLLPFYILLPEDPIPHDIMTESLTYPLVYLYAAVVLAALWKDSILRFYAALGISLIMTLIRGQMMLFMGVTLIVYVYHTLRHRMGARTAAVRIAVFVVACLAVYKCDGLICSAYEAHFFGAHTQSYAAQTFVQKALFCADKEDAGLFDDEVTREIFERTYDQMMIDESTYAYTPDDLSAWKMITASFGANSYAVGTVTQEVLAEHGMLADDPLDIEAQVLDYSRRLTSALLRAHPGRALSVSISMMPAGFVSSVLFHKESIYLIIHIMTLILYVAAVALSIVIPVRRDESGSREDDSHVNIPHETELMWLIILTAAANVIGSNLIHFGLQRYMAYTIGLFYAAGYLCLRRVILSCRKKQQ